MFFFSFHAFALFRLVFWEGGEGIGKALHLHSFLFFFSVWDCFLFIFVFFPFVVYYPSLLTAMFGGTTWNMHGMDGGWGCADTLSFGIVE